MWLLNSLLPILAMNVVLYFILKKYFGFVRTWLYVLLVGTSIFVGYVLDMQAFDSRGYMVPVAMGICFALLVAICIYDKLFDNAK